MLVLVEFLKRDLIMESLSPCVVSILLTSKRTKTWRMCFDDTRADLLD